jgi:hypothetical protein
MHHTYLQLVQPQLDVGIQVQFFFEPQLAGFPAPAKQCD